jgi:hypothetical protein
MTSFAHAHLASAKPRRSADPIHLRRGRYASEVFRVPRFRCPRPESRQTKRLRLRRADRSKAKAREEIPSPAMRESVREGADCGWLYRKRPSHMTRPHHEPGTPNSLPARCPTTRASGPGPALARRAQSCLCPKFGRCACRYLASLRTWL